MEATREIYWNVGHGVIVPMYLLVIAASAFMLWGFFQRVSVWKRGKKYNCTDRYKERLQRMITQVIGQERVFRVKDGGLYHAFFFWGIVTLFIGTLIVMLQADILTPLAGVNLLSGSFYKLFSLSLDIAGVVAITMLAALFIRRFFIRPEGLETVAADYGIHFLLFAVLITGFVIEAARMAATELPLNSAISAFSPAGLILAKGMVSVSADGLKTIHTSLWWLHFALVLAFIAFLPFTKLRHIILTSANAFFAPLEEKGALANINMEDESIEQYGAAKISDLTWKDIFDADACVSCKRCQDRCPAYNTDKPLSPMKLIKQIGEVAEKSPEASLTEAITTDAIWACTTCRACQDICPSNNEHVNKILELRRNLSLMEGEFPGDEVKTAINNVEVNGNPFGLAYAGRGDWAKELELALLSSGEEFDILYFVGCYASFDKRNQEVAKNFIKICKSAGIKVGILGKEEKCCGEPVRKLGNEYLYQMTALENIECIKAYNVKKIVTTCPHCFNTLARDYKDLGMEIPVEHYTTYINNLLEERKLSLNQEPFRATYHDSCYLGRYMDIINEPRSILKASGGTIVEMEKSRYDSFCCSGGGGRILAEEKLGERINVARIKMALSTNAPVLVSNCPFCLTMFEDGIKTGGAEGSLKVRDLAEIVSERLVA